jgi:uncharacterized protein YyaL (SSP411 family)
MAVTILLKLAGLSSEPRYVGLAHEALTPMQSMIAQYPLGFGQWLHALSYALSQPKEVAIVGEPGVQDTKALLAVAQGNYRPFQVVALGAPDPDDATVPLLRDRSLVDGHPTAYICVDFACQAPVTDPKALQALLEKP